MNLGLRRMIVMFVRSVVRSGCRRAPRGRSRCPAGGIGSWGSRTFGPFLGCPFLSSFFFETMGPSAFQFFTSDFAPWCCPPPPPRPSSPISPCKSQHRYPPVDRLLPPPGRQNNPARPRRVLFLFQVTQRHSSLPCAAPAPASFPLSRTSPAREDSAQTWCKSHQSPWQISRRP